MYGGKYICLLVGDRDCMLANKGINLSSFVTLNAETCWQPLKAKSSIMDRFIVMRVWNVSQFLWPVAINHPVDICITKMSTH